MAWNCSQNFLQYFSKTSGITRRTTGSERRNGRSGRDRFVNPPPAFFCAFLMDGFTTGRFGRRGRGLLGGGSEGSPPGAFRLFMMRIFSSIRRKMILEYSISDVKSEAFEKHSSNIEVLVNTNKFPNEITNQQKRRQIWRTNPWGRRLLLNLFDEWVTGNAYLENFWKRRYVNKEFLFQDSFKVRKNLPLS